MTGIKLLIILGLFLLAGWTECYAEQVPTIRDWKKGVYCHLESTYAGLLGMKTMPETIIVWEDTDD